MTRSASAAGALGRVRPSVWSSAGRDALFYVAAALAVVAVSLSIAVDRVLGPAPDVVAFAVAVVSFGGSQLVRVRIRIGRDDVIMGWPEVGVTAALCLVPPMWAPIVAAAGVTLALGPRLFRARPAGRTKVMLTMSVLVLATSAGSVVCALLGPVDAPVVVDVERPATIFPLVGAGLATFAVGSSLMAAWLMAATRDSFRVTWLLVARAKRVILAGTAAVSLATAVLIGVSVVWLAVLAPVLWILHWVYDHQLRAGQERLTWATLADATRGLNQLDESGVALAVLRGASRLFGPDLAEVVLQRPQGSRRVYRARPGNPLSMSTVDEPASVAREPEVRRLSVGTTEIGEIRLHLRRGARLSEADRHAFSTFADAAASAFHDAATHRTLRAMTARSAYDALHDSLTGLSNRSTLLARGNTELGKLPPAAPVALVLFDVGGLRQVNDTLGYAAGDELLAIVARRILELLVDEELVGRLGGDEFALLLLAPGEPGQGYAVQRARQLTAELARPCQVAGVAIAVELSVGVVVECAGACDMTELVRRADVALHQAKQDDNRLGRYEAAQDASNTDRLALLADLRDALAAGDQFELHLQPKVDLQTGQPVGVEALARWRHPRRGLLQPADFIGVVEHSDLARGFTLHVIDKALALASGWASQGLHLPISVNLCARCTLDPDLPSLVAERLAAHGVPARRLVLEITETVAMTEPGLAERVVTRLRDLGVRVSVDDFGTGSASLSFLARFPVDEVKIDRTFIATMVDSAETAAIVRATVDLAHDLGMKVVAEGVERPEQRAALVELGVGAAQGFLFHRPLPPDEVTPALQGRAHTATAKRIPIVRAPLA